MLTIKLYTFTMIIHTSTSEYQNYESYPKDEEDPNKLAKLMAFGVIATACFVMPSVDI